ncbi:fumarylacetoacetate hydrolase family protein [Sphaerotilus microaerophilus]|uniref:Fumarylacetoacetate hydrolase n=1 Tax=Sphaerotilus microaerophilus TaxID=2914710 RepID=A0ABM7YGN4_9BURK|nr:fumarylacetoacetate hydrolase family protein [Sphaerotilus sp. FB-5]BDI03326.1 fumarylacetoacetate hydrolase [Sphaerotilus sp. FB-5]
MSPTQPTSPPASTAFPPTDGAARVRMDVAPWRLSGVVVAAQINHRPQLAALAEAARRAPYKALPGAPVLAVQSRNTLALDGDEVPAGADGLDVGATLGIVIGRVACRVSAADALAHVAGYLVANDLSAPIPGDTPHYRPGARFKLRDRSCPLGAEVVPAAAVADPDALAVRVWIDGALAQATDTAERLRGVAQLIADVSEFMTLNPGDVLLLGISQGAPRALPGQTVSIEIDGVGRLTNRLVHDDPSTGSAA